MFSFIVLFLIFAVFLFTFFLRVFLFLGVSEFFFPTFFFFFGGGWVFFWSLIWDAISL